MFSENVLESWVVLADANERVYSNKARVVRRVLRATDASRTPALKRTGHSTNCRPQRRGTGSSQGGNVPLADPPRRYDAVDSAVATHDVAKSRSNRAQ